MRLLLFALVPVALAGCAPAGPAGHADAELACRSQGYAPDSVEWRYCMRGGGAAIATGPGSPYANRNPMD